MPRCARLRHAHGEAKVSCLLTSDGGVSRLREIGCPCPRQRGLKLPVPPQRREVVSELAGQGMSNRAISDVVNVAPTTVGADRQVSNSGQLGDNPGKSP